MIDGQSPLRHQLLQIAQAQAEAQIPAHARHDHLRFELAFPEQRWAARSHGVHRTRSAAATLPSRAFVNNRASVTAEYMALFRVLESSRRSRLFFDPYGTIFLTGGRKRLARLTGLPGGRRLAEWLLDRVSPGARAAGIARTKWIDDEATAALVSATQLVLLGAGFDVRALRLPQATQALTFELDHPQTSSAKQAALKSRQPTLSERIRYVGIDFNCESIADVLLNAGFDTS